MELKVLRQEFTRKSTIGRLLVDGQFECYTLEDRVRPTKIYGETAIPSGRYQVVISMSERFKRRLPLLVDVPNYSGVRIHPGNTDADTLGCILVGQSKAADSIGSSRAAFAALMPKLEAAAQAEKVFIEVVDEGVPLPAERGARGRPPAARKKAAATKAPARKAPARKPAARKAAKKVAKRAAAQSSAQKTPSKKIVAKKTVAKKTAAKTARAAKKAPAPRAPIRRR
jgi:hypothetical protein